jgi:hypothetical protein
VYPALKKRGKDEETVLMVVGAGRGPLVAGALRAAKQAQRKLKVYAVDKNPNAVITLRNRKVAEGWDNVTVVDTDMRVWNAPEKADILVSELLGSFGDNELSPECLDGAQVFLKGKPRSPFRRGVLLTAFFALSLSRSALCFLQPIIGVPNLWLQTTASAFLARTLLIWLPSARPSCTMK